MPVAEALVPLGVARERVLGACGRLPARSCSLDDALGCVLAEAVVAGEPVPPFDNTAMDGYAVRSADTAGAPVRLEVAGTLRAGARPDLEVGAGQAVRIMTGAPLPGGADAVVMVERTRTEGRLVVIERPARPGDHVRPAGDDIATGVEIFPPGTALGPAHIGVLSSAGCDGVKVVPRARVGVLSSGDELVEGAGTLEPGQIRDSNRHALLALVRESGFEPVDLGIVADDEARLSAAVQAGARSCDALLTTGGVSVGDYDLVKVVLDHLSEGSMSWMQVAIKPAKPFAFGTVGGTPVFGLPGNPVSSMVSFEVLARPALRSMAGHTEIDRPRVDAVAEEDLCRSPDGKLHLVRAVAAPRAGGGFGVRSAGRQGSHLLTSMAAANALAMLADGDGVRAGEAVETILLWASVS